MQLWERNFKLVNERTDKKDTGQFIQLTPFYQPAKPEPVKEVREKKSKKSLIPEPELTIDSFVKDLVENAEKIDVSRYKDLLSESQ